MKDPVLHIHLDSGVPEGSTDYTTVILLHGFAWHGGVFAKMIPPAHAHNARLVLVNRRDYPGSKPYTPAELALLKRATALVSTDAAGARTLLASFMRDRAREVYDFLVHFIADNDVPAADAARNAGGIVLAGWSFSSAWMTALLAHVGEFPMNDVEVDRYVRRVVLYDGPYHSMGYPPPSDPYNPLWDASLGSDATRAFAMWVSGYFQHGDSADAIERRTPLANPAPTLSTLTDEERESALYPGPGEPSGSDGLLLAGGIQSGLYEQLKNAALYLPEEIASPLGEDGDEMVTSAWSDVEVRYIWCERSVWEMTWTSWKMREEMREAQAQGKNMRNLKILRLLDANHFVHWDEPERCLKAFLAPETASSE
ncbi:uncharacterized protein BXZ73DRAFT_100822 [Epithele typhae]|uniref:uncharacterized protein n=1 Tax=Epithele typhae TaxID=378194 RepID=UPI00200850B5|nr:uncharacterized protein BXZ73DRAFT_100822 [Epithele typhae]KAH9933984.1 hypothetical protein BXZ73DRAFT_100822 [Epithele typhae]